MFSNGPPHMAEQKQGDQFEPTYSSSVRIWDVALRMSQKWWTIGRSGERGSGISMLAAQHDDDDDDLFSKKDFELGERRRKEGRENKIYVCVCVYVSIYVYSLTTYIQTIMWKKMWRKN